MVDYDKIYSNPYPEPDPSPDPSLCGPCEIIGVETFDYLVMFFGAGVGWFILGFRCGISICRKQTPPLIIASEIQ